MPYVAKTSQYEDTCREALARIGRVDVPWQVLEASMRLEYNTLDSRSRADFVREARIAAECWDQDRPGSIALAESYALPVLA